MSVDSFSGFTEYRSSAVLETNYRVKLTVEFPSVSYREGPESVIRLAQAIEAIGYDELDMFDHVVMGYSTPERGDSRYPPKMPILEALMTLSFLASVTSRIRLGTEVLVLPQRQPALVARQVSTLDTLSGGRVRLGVGVGWQASEFEALGETFTNRGRRTDEAIELLRAYFSDTQVDYQGEYYRSTAMAMEPKSPQGAALPIWVGGRAEASLCRGGTHGDGWLANAFPDNDQVKACKEIIAESAVRAGREPAKIGYQTQFDVPPRDAEGKQFYADLDRVAVRAVQIQEQGFGQAAINATAIFQSGARSVDAMIESLSNVFERVKSEVG